MKVALGTKILRNERRTNILKNSGSNTRSKQALAWDWDWDWDLECSWALLPDFFTKKFTAQDSTILAYR